jgi:hypothetical protein
LEQFTVIRRDRRIEGLSIRAVADKHHVHRVHGAPGTGVGDSAGPQDAAAGGASAGAVKAAIDAMLRSDLDTPQKQRRTARLLARLVDEHGAVGLSYSTVRDHVRQRRPQLLAEAATPRGAFRCAMP